MCPQVAALCDTLATDNIMEQLNVLTCSSRRVFIKSNTTFGPGENVMTLGYLIKTLSVSFGVGKP